MSATSSSTTGIDHTTAILNSNSITNNKPNQNCVVQLGTSMLVIISIFGTLGVLLFLLVSYFLIKRCLSWCRLRRKRKSAVKPLDKLESKPPTTTTTEAYLSNNEGSSAADQKKRVIE